MYNKVIILVIVLIIFLSCRKNRREFFSPAYHSCKNNGYPEKFCQLVPDEIINKNKLNNCRHPYLPLRK